MRTKSDNFNRPKRKWSEMLRSVFAATCAGVILLSVVSCASIAKEDDKACYEIRNRLNLLDFWYNDYKGNWTSEVFDAANPQQVAVDLEKISLYDISSDLRDAAWGDAQLARSGKSVFAMKSPSVCESKFKDKYDYNF